MAPLWKEFEASGSATAYQRHDWLSGLSRHLARAGSELLFVEVQDAASGRPLMLVPLHRQRRFGVWIANWIDFGVCDYAAPVLAPGAVLSADEAAAAWAAVLSALPAVDLIDIGKIPADLEGTANPLALLPRCRETSLQAFGIDLAGDTTTLARGLLGSKAYRNLQRQIERLRQHGAVRLLEPSGPDEVEALYGELVDQRRRRFREMGRHDILNTPAVESFYRDMAVRGVTEGGPARLFGLAVGEEIVAAAYMLLHKGSLHGLLLSIGSTEWNAYSPGLLLATKLIQWAADHDLTYFDMTLGSLSYKARLGGKPRTLHRILEPRTGLGRLAATVLAAGDHAETWLGNRPGLHGRLRTIRRRLRRLSSGRRR